MRGHVPETRRSSPLRRKWRGMRRPDLGYYIRFVLNSFFYIYIISSKGEHEAPPPFFPQLMWADQFH